MFKDIDIFVQAAQAILQGGNPYALPGLEVFYPLPFYFLFVPFVGLPVTLVHIVWTILQAAVLLAVLRSGGFIAILSMPVLLTILLGQIDLVMLGLFVSLRTEAVGIALAFMSLKPQLVLLLAPWILWQSWHGSQRQIFIFAAVLGSVILVSFVLQPDWLAYFFARSGERTRAAVSSSLWGLLAFLPAPIWLPLSALVAIAVAIWAWRTGELNIVAAAGLLASPFIFSYNLLPLLAMLKKRWLQIGFTVASWVTFAVSAIVSNDRAGAFLTIVVLVYLIAKRHSRNLPRVQQNPSMSRQ